MSGALRPISAFQQTQRPARDYERVASNSVFTSYRVRVPEWSSGWVLELRKRLDELTALPVGWDGYAGQPVSFQCANFVANMLERLCQDNVPAPSLVPGSDGSLQVEWHRNHFDVELDVLGVQNVVATRVNQRTGDEESVEIQNDFSEIVDWISALSNDAEVQR
jgi:hypothetical protein